MYSLTTVYTCVQVDPQISQSNFLELKFCPKLETGVEDKLRKLKYSTASLMAKSSKFNVRVYKN